MSQINFKRTLSQGAKALNTALRSLLPPNVGLEFDLVDANNDRKTIGISLPDRHGGFVQASLRGTGFRRLLSVLGILLAKFSEEDHCIVLYDEPEVSLHAEAQHCLRRVLESIAQKPNVQVIYATHSPSMINTLHPEGIRLFTRTNIEGKGCTVVDNKPFGANFATVRMSLGITPADSLLYAPVTIVTEGRTEVACLVKILQKLHSKEVHGFEMVPTLLESCHVVDGQGDGLDYLCRLAKSQGAAPILFVDGDKIRQVEQLKAAGKLEGIPVVTLQRATEFEDLVPIEKYFESLGAELAADPGDLRTAYAQYVEQRGLPKQMMFTKRVFRWLEDTRPEYIYEKARVMSKALEQTPVAEIRCEELRALVKAMKDSLNAVAGT